MNPVSEETWNSPEDNDTIDHHIYSSKHGNAYIEFYQRKVKLIQTRLARWNVSFPPCVQTVRTFSLKGMTSKLFGQETAEQREAKLQVLEQQIEEGEEAVKEKNTESE